MKKLTTIEIDTVFCARCVCYDATGKYMYTNEFLHDNECFEHCCNDIKHHTWGTSYVMTNERAMWFFGFVKEGEKYPCWEKGKTELYGSITKDGDKTTYHTIYC
jgi:hypothetical protein